MATSPEIEQVQESPQERARSIARQLLVGEFPDLAEELSIQRGDNPLNDQDILFGETTVGAFTLTSLEEALKADPALARYKPHERRAWASAITGELRNSSAFKVNNSGSERIPGSYDAKRNLFYREGFDNAQQAIDRIEQFKAARAKKIEKATDSEELKSPVSIYLFSYFTDNETNEQDVLQKIHEVTEVLPAGSVENASFLGEEDRIALEESILAEGYGDFIVKIMHGDVARAELPAIIARSRRIFMENADKRVQQAHDTALQIIETAKARSRANVSSSQALLIKVGEPWDLLVNQELESLTAKIPNITYGEENTAFVRSSYLPYEEKIIRIWAQRFLFSTLQDNHDTLLGLSQIGNPEGIFGLALFDHPEVARALQQGAREITLAGAKYSRDQVDAILERLLVSDTFVMSALAETVLFLSVANEEWRNTTSADQIMRLMVSVHICINKMTREELITFLTDPRQDQQFMKGPLRDFEDARRLENEAKGEYNNARRQPSHGRRSHVNVGVLEKAWRVALRTTKEKNAILRDTERLFRRRAQETFDTLRQRIIAERASQQEKQTQ